MLSTTKPSPRRPSIHIPGSSNSSIFDLYSDARDHGYKGPSRTVRLPRATSGGVGAIAKSEDGVRCAVAGKESLRILRVCEPSTEHKSAVGHGIYKIDASRNLWTGSGLKIDSASTDVAWGRGVYDNKLLTSARNGELIMWDLNKSGPSKYERKTKDHVRSIHKLAYSHIVPYYCVTGSADGDVRIWDLRTMSKSINKIRHPTSVRSVVLSPSTSRPLEAVVGLDNGSIYRWDLTKGQLGQLDRLPVAHVGPILALDWCIPPTFSQNTNTGSFGGVPSLGEVLGASVTGSGSAGAGGESDQGGGWIVSGGLDQCVKVWDLSNPNNTSHIPHKPTYTLNTSFPVRRVLWRPDYECEIAVVSNAEFISGSNPDSSLGSSIGTSGSDLGGEDGIAENDAEFESRTGGVGDAIEIWDVRRGWIAKWSVSGSAVEGGVTDIAFGDSHAIWAHHSSGTFSQLDLRQSTKPLDAVPRVAATWEASGSMAFVADRRPKWEVPYDDLDLEKRTVVQERKAKIKALGDVSYVPSSQSVGAYMAEDALDDTATFVTLARGYVSSGSDRQNICNINADLAFQVGKDEAAQVWLLVGSLLTDLTPSAPPTPPLSPPPPLPHSVSAPADLPLLKSSPSAAITNRRASSSDPAIKAQHDSPSPSRTSGSTNYGSDRRAHSSSVRPSPRATPTPTSSTSPSPSRRPLPTVLPTPTTPLSSAFPRRESSTTLFRPKSLSTYRRPSMSAHSMQSESPSDSIKSHVSLRHVGEGALDDSDSSGSDGGQDVSMGPLQDEESGSLPLKSAGVHAKGTPNPSPLSRVAERENWTEDEDVEDREDEDSPSPASSTDSEESDHDSPPRRVQRGSLTRRGSARKKSRSRSSTLASLAASSSRPTLLKQESYSSMRTVLAGDASLHESVEDLGIRKDDTIQDLRGAMLSRQHGSRRTSPGTRGQKPSQTLPNDFALNGEDYSNQHIYPGRGRRRRSDVLRTKESKFRDLGWKALRVTLENFAEEGDVQMCALLCLVAPTELRMDERRIVRFLESYIDILSRLQLHASAAYVRKSARAEDIRSKTMLETTVQLSCGQCRKPMSSGSGPTPYCPSCKSMCTKCAICHLPVKTLLFQCPVCGHGGHQECYRRYYADSMRPMVELPSASAPSENRGRPTTRNSPLLVGGNEDEGLIPIDSGSDRGSNVALTRLAKLSGHPCASGCGHFCWAANEATEDT